MLSVKSTFLNFQTFSVNLIIIIIIIIIITIIKIIKALFKTERPISEVREEDAGIHRWSVSLNYLVKNNNQLNNTKIAIATSSMWPAHDARAGFQG